MNAWGLTNVGIIRSENQDAFETYLLPAQKKGVCVVCDGMGGANAGGTASRLAVDAFQQEVVGRLKDSMKVEAMALVAKEAVERANYTVFRRASEEPWLEGMGTTLVAALMSGKNTVVVNVGDSRAYHVTGEGIFRMTEDHSVVEDMIRRGDLTRERAHCHPIRNLITRAVGTESTIKCDIFKADINRGEFIILCSDGLSNVVSEPEILFEVIHGGPLETCCARLIDIAMRRGAPDNITVVIIER